MSDQAHPHDMDDYIVVRVPDGTHRRIRSHGMLTGTRIDAVVWVGPRCDTLWLENVEMRLVDLPTVKRWRAFVYWREWHKKHDMAPPTIVGGPS